MPGMANPSRIIEATPALWNVQTFARALRGIVLTLYNNQTDTVNFFDAATQIIYHGYISAWYQGAKMVGVMPDELTPEEAGAMQASVFQQLLFLQGFADYIFQNSRAMNNSLPAVINRMSLWLNRWNQFVNQGRMMASLDKKAEWVMGPTEHCPSCLKLSGKVKRNSQWIAAGIHPQSRLLACGGFRCKCQLLPTDKPMSKGRLPKIP